MTVDDNIYENFSDVGVDTLGPSDSIRAGSDTYTWGTQRLPGHHDHRLRRRGHAVPHPGLFVRQRQPGPDRL